MCIITPLLAILYLHVCMEVGRYRQAYVGMTAENIFLLGGEIMATLLDKYF